MDAHTPTGIGSSFTPAVPSGSGEEKKVVSPEAEVAERILQNAAENLREAAPINPARVTLLTPAFQAPQASMVARIEKTLEDAVRDQHFSGVAMVVHRGHVLVNKGYGQARVGAEMDENTVMHVGSITKQFTAAAILKLSKPPSAAQEAKIDLHASINKYLPEKYRSPKWESVTVHHLLSHTGGIADYTINDYESGTKGFSTPGKIEEMINTSKEKEVGFGKRTGSESSPEVVGPGKGMEYCNIGYTLLGAIIEEQAGCSYSTFIRKNFLEPLEMTSSGIHDEAYVAGESHAEGHRWDDEAKGLVADDRQDLPVTPPDGGLFTTSADLRKWSEALAGKRPDVLSREILEQMTTPATEVVTKAGEHTLGRYGYGLFVDDSSGTKRINHSGAIVGFGSEFYLYPEKELYISVFGNVSAHVFDITSNLSKIVLEGEEKV